MAEKHGATLKSVTKRLERILQENPCLAKKLSSTKRRSRNRAKSASKILGDSGKICELLTQIEECGSRIRGMKTFAENNGVKLSGVKNVFYSKILTPELNQRLPLGVQQKPKTKPVVKQTDKTITIEQAIIDTVKAKKELPLKKEDIQVAAEKAGVHYHTALGVWGKMNAKELAIAQNTGVTIAQVLELYDIINEQKEKIAKLESLLSASRRVSLCAIEMLANKNKTKNKKFLVALGQKKAI
ncbi:hypothetical protein ACOBQJ_03535 [Pelotomaculum propionicicum]|uniref:hypothetical protein n=1 Tax=Pelotomaculum propionicicum TaxID=258475 RepID=UPI003B7BED89